jgi:spore coat polysaccharide biosynthesis protein SpsF (cytidylyltransferase family)
MGSHRLPGKVMMEIGDKPIIQHVIDVLNAAKLVQGVIVAIPEEDRDSRLWDHLHKKVPIVTGSLDDLVSRFRKACDIWNLKYFMRVCADSPMLSVSAIDGTVKTWLGADDKDRIVRSEGPPGQNVEIVPAQWLHKHHKDMNGDDREHVTRYFYRMKFPVTSYDASHIPFGGVIDTMSDLIKVREWYEGYGHRRRERR